MDVGESPSGTVLEKMRRPYLERHQVLNSTDLEFCDPYEIWESWFNQASQVIKEMGSPNEPNQMALATSTKDGNPSLRYVLLKGQDESGFYFYTNYLSRKGRELEENPRASICMYWPEVHRMVTIEGVVTKVTPERSNAYFKSRPIDSQIGATVSQQSSVIPSREILESRRRELEVQLSSGASLERPKHWGGFRLEPSSFEFWQGQRDRLHDRLRFRRQSGTPADGWICERLSP